MTSFLFSRSLLLVVASVVILPTIALAATTTVQGLPQAGMISPRTAVREKSVTYSAQVIDNEILKSCELMVDEKSVGSMTIKIDVVYKSYKISKDGTYQMNIKCKDKDDHEVSGFAVPVVVSLSSTHAAPGDRIKAACPGEIYPNHPCTAVYYFGVDGKRHAFPNERVYKSWFKDFDDLVILSSSAMAEIPLGKNVTFRPGERLVKFTTNTVYGISFAGLLRPIASGEIAEAMYGKNWTTMIESVDDVFYGNYRIGAIIEGSNDFTWSAPKSETNVIDETF